MPAPLTADSIRRAPKVLLHDHLDGGLRPQTVIELAEAHGYRDLPTTDADELARWFRQAADSGIPHSELIRFQPNTKAPTFPTTDGGGNFNPAPAPI